jgi:hypothetical protein
MLVGGAILDGGRFRLPSPPSGNGFVAPNLVSSESESRNTGRTGPASKSACERLQQTRVMWESGEFCKAG